MNKLIAIAVLLMGANAMALPYADAGCGLGSMVFGNDNTNFKQVIGATLNGTSGNQTFGITSGTSNCEVGGAVRGAQAIPAFIEVNTLALAKDASRGQGETLASLANLMGCQSQNLGPAMKKHYQPIFVDSKMDPTQIEAGINQLIVADKSACVSGS